MSGLTNPFDARRPGRVVVLGHPGHELAIFGLLQRHPPDLIIVVSDGGPPERMAQSRQGLAGIGLLDRAHYLSVPEDEFYRALLDRDHGFLSGVVDAVAAEIARVEPSQVFCDAVEFYNPVHDLTLPIVRSALGASAAAIYEIPLAYQTDDEVETYRVQRVPPALADRRLIFALTPEETDAKRHARDAIYRSLHQQAGPDLLDVPTAELAREELFLSLDPVPQPGDGRLNRYERRARELLAQRRISRMITYAGHFAPVVDALGVPRAGAAGRASPADSRPGLSE